ncbi:MAG TPA: ketoacyl-ACP synthase III [Candidatus Binatia bacterium]|nr:ketoacyl-ACP synthase III [Candidatus Binatia bacterium]
MGHCLPERRVDNQELAEMLGIAGAEVATRSGVRSRFFAAEGEGPSDLARAAGEIALNEAGIDATDIEFILFATMTPDVTFPGSGCYLQKKLGCRTIGALDLRAQCAGFLFALEVADQFLRAGAYRRVLIAAGDVHSAGLDFSPRGAAVTPLFGDGAVVAVLDAEGDGVVGSVIHTDASRFEEFWCELPSSRRRPTRFLPQDLPLGRHYPSLDANAVRREGRQRLRSAVDEVLMRSNVRRDEVQRFFLQHVYRDTALTAAEDLGVSARAAVGGLEEGHIASASLPLALCRARQNGEVRTGELVCLATAGSGANWGAALVRL